MIKVSVASAQEIEVKAKVKVSTLDIAPLRDSSSQKRSGIARVLKGSHSFTMQLHTHVHPQSE